jgi:hypothetical protein
MSALYYETCQNSFKQIVGKFLEFTMLNVINYIRNILFQSLQVMRIAGIDDIFYFSPQIQVTEA